MRIGADGASAPMEISQGWARYHWPEKGCLTVSYCEVISDGLGLAFMARSMASLVAS